MQGRDIPIDDIVAMLEDRIEDLVAVLYPGATIVKGVAYPEPKSKFDLGSFQIYFTGGGKHQRGHWRRYSQRIGGGPLQLITYALSHETVHVGRYGEAVAWAKEWLGIGAMSTSARAEFDRQREIDRRRAARERAAAEARAAADADRARLHAMDIWRGTIAVTEGDPVWVYLTEARRLPLDIRRFPGQIRYHPDLKHFGGKDHRGPAMVARPIIRGARASGVHCTFLKPLGRGKAFRGSASKLMRGEIQGGIVPISLGSGSLADLERLGFAEPVILAEGLETGLALAASLVDVRVWSCLSLSNIGLAPVDHPAVSDIFIAAENDQAPAAIDMLNSVVEALERTGRRVTLMRSHVGSDFADLF